MGVYSHSSMGVYSHVTLQDCLENGSSGTVGCRPSVCPSQSDSSGEIPRPAPRRTRGNGAAALYVVSRDADHINGWRFDANLWDASLPPAEAARHAGRPAGFEMHPQPT
jgi:hypothetical protein